MLSDVNYANSSKRICYKLKKNLILYELEYQLTLKVSHLREVKTAMGLFWGCHFTVKGFLENHRPKVKVSRTDIAVKLESDTLLYELNK